MYIHPKDHVILVNVSACSGVYSLVHSCYPVVFNKRLYGYGFLLFLNLETNDVEVSAKYWISLINTHCSRMTNTYCTCVALGPCLHIILGVAGKHWNQCSNSAI